jgi:hypothetical protein
MSSFQRLQTSELQPRFFEGTKIGIRVLPQAEECEVRLAGAGVFGGITGVVIVAGLALREGSDSTDSTLHTDNLCEGC